MLAVLAAGLDHLPVDFPHLGMVVLPGQPHVGEHVVQPDQHDVDAFDGDDLVGALQRIGGFELHDHHGGVVDRLAGLLRGKRTVLQLREQAGVGALALRRQLCGLDHGASFVGGAHVRRDDAECAGVEHAARYIPACWPARARRA